MEDYPDGHTKILPPDLFIVTGLLYIMYINIVVYIYTCPLPIPFIIRICTYTREHVWHPTVKVQRDMRIENNNNNISNIQINNKIRLSITYGVYLRCS